MDLKDKQKNLLDIIHQRYLNYFNICAIIGLTIGFTVIWAKILGQISFDLMGAALFVDMIIFGVILLLIHGKIKIIIGEIENL